MKQTGPLPPEAPDAVRTDRPFEAANQQGVALLSAHGSERATNGNGGKIATCGGKTHIVWQDSTPEGYFARIRTLDHQTEQWSDVRTIGQGRDNHARPTLTVDSKGYLHVIIGGHQTGLQYLRSRQPNDASAWTEITEFGNNTYPVLICGPDDTLYLTARHDAQWQGLDLYTKPPDGAWSSQGMLVRKQEQYQFYAAFHNGLAWGPDHQTLHLALGFFMGDAPREGMHNRDMQGLHQAMGYMRSDDFGRTWTKADGTPIEPPATTETIDLLDEGRRDAAAHDKPKPDMHHCGLVVDSINQPYVVCVRHAPERLHERPLGEAIEHNWPGWGVLECSVSITRDDLLCLAMTLAPREHPDADWYPGEYGRPTFWLRNYPTIKRIAWLESADGGRTFRLRDVIPFNDQVGQLHPKLEVPMGHNQIPASTHPPMIYFEGVDQINEQKAGDPRDPKNNNYTPGQANNRVYYVRPRVNPA